MNRTWLVVAGFAAGIAIFGGWALGRSLLSKADSAARRKTVAASSAQSKNTPFREPVSGVSLSYPSSWTARTQRDPSAALLVAAPDGAMSLLVRVAVTRLEKVTAHTLPIARRFTDPLVRADKSVKLLGAPKPVQIGGLPGYRYRYSYGNGTGAHDHYFFFKQGRLISLTFQAVPAARLQSGEPQFDRIVRTFRGNGPA